MCYFLLQSFGLEEMWPQQPRGARFGAGKGQSGKGTWAELKIMPAGLSRLVAPGAIFQKPNIKPHKSLKAIVLLESGANFAL